MVWPRYKLTMGKMTMVNLNKFSFKENNYAIYIVNDICVYCYGYLAHLTHMTYTACISSETQEAWAIWVK